MLFLGIRALIKGDENVLRSQFEDARLYFPGSKLILAVCGEEPSAALGGLCDAVLYYSEKPMGLTLPWHLLVEYAQNHGAERLILCDGDDQFIFSELKRVYDAARDCDAVIPIRTKKSLFFCDECLDAY